MTTWIVTRSRPATAVAALLAPAIALAQPMTGERDGGTPSRDGAEVQRMDPLAPPPIMREGDMRYMTGGVAIGERRAMQRAARDFDLHLSFSEAGSGQYVAFVDVTLLDGQGRPVLQVADAGPWLFVDLPRGTYQVQATYDGRTETRRVTVGGGQPTLAAIQWRNGRDRG